MKFQVLDTDFGVTAIHPKRLEVLDGHRGVTVEQDRTRIRTEVRRMGNDVYAVACPIDGTLFSESLGKKLSWEFAVAPGSVFKGKGSRCAKLAVSESGGFMNARCIQYLDNDVRQYKLVGIRDSFAQAEASMGSDHAEWQISCYRFGKANGARVQLHKTTHALAFPEELVNMALLAKPGSRFAEKSEIMDMISQHLEESVTNEEDKKGFSRFVDALAVTYLRMCGQSASLTKPGDKQTTSTAKPEVVEHTATDADDGEEYEAPELTLVTSTPEPKPDDQAIAEEQAAAMSEEKKVRGKKAAKKPAKKKATTAKRGKGGAQKTGTDYSG